MSTNAPKVSNINLDAADRAASSIRPSWELDEAEFEAPPAATPIADKLAAGGATPEIAKIAAAFSTTNEIPRDTVIDGVPTVAVGRTIDIGPTPNDVPVKVKSERAPPPAKPKATRFGLGSDPGPPPSAETEAPLELQTTVHAPPRDDSAPGASEPPARVESERPREATSAASPAAANATMAYAPPAPVQPIAASFSRADDPIEIPVQKSKAIYLVAGVLALGAVIGGAVFFSGGSETKDKKSDAAATSTAAAAPEKTVAATATATTAPLPAPTQTATTAAAPTASASAAPAESAKPVESAKPAEPPKQPIAQDPVPARPPPAGGGPKPPPAGGGQKPPPKGGIIHDTPF